VTKVALVLLMGLGVFFSLAKGSAVNSTLTDALAARSLHNRDLLLDSLEVQIIDETSTNAGMNEIIDGEEVRAFFGLAAEQEHAEAQNNLGKMHYHGQDGTINREEARTFFGLTAEKGHAEAQNNLGEMYLNGRGGDVDEEKARILFERAADQQYAPALYNLARMHAYGIGGPVDGEEARRLLHLAAGKGSAEAKHVLAVNFNEVVEEASNKTVSI